jgi:hypothetical protein
MRLSYRLCLVIAALLGLASCSHATPPPAAVTTPHPVAVPALPRGPLVTFSDGTYEVGTDVNEIAPGKYRTAGPMGGPSVDGSDTDKKCYWGRLKDFTGSVQSVVAMQYGNHGPDIVLIEPTDKGFETRACGTWTRMPS